LRKKAKIDDDGEEENDEVINGAKKRVDVDSD